MFFKYIEGRSKFIIASTQNSCAIFVVKNLTKYGDKLKNMPHSENRDKISIDRGWAWFVMFGVHFGFMLGYGYLTTLGIFYTEWIDYFGSTATATSWLISIPWMVASPLCKYYIYNWWVGAGEGIHIFL